MFNVESFPVNDKGHLEIGGCDVLDLADEYGTPLYVMDEIKIKNACRNYMHIMSKFYSDFKVIYASKAFSCKEICRIMNEEGMHLDVVSGGELHTALQANFPAEKIYFHGNNKTDEELLMSVQNNVGVIVIDSIHEANTLSDIACKLNKSMNVIVRIKPGVEAHTHSFIKTGQIDSKFGFAIENGEAINVLAKIKSLKGLNLIGLHCHIGSQIFDSEPFVHAAEVMIDFINEVKKSLKLELSELNLGGGFGIKYSASDEGMDYEECLKHVSQAINDKCKKYGLKCPRICIEPGRSIVGPSGITLYKVGNIKDIEGIRTYISIDGGMTDNPRYILYKSKYDIINAGKANAKKDKVVTVAGKCCESGDIIQENVNLCHTDIGDILAVLCTGAYNYSMASNYNRIPKPAVVMVNNGKHRLIVKRQSVYDITAQDL